MCIGIAQTFSRHVRDEVARNYIISEIVQHALGINQTDGKGMSTSPWLKTYVSKDDVLRKYVYDCSTLNATFETVPDLDLPDSLFENLGPEEVDNAAEAAITWYGKISSLRVSKF